MIRRPNPEHIGVLKNFYPLVKTIDNIARFYGQDLLELWPEYHRTFRIIEHMFEGFMTPESWANSLNEARYLVITRLSRNIIRQYNKARTRDLRRPTNYRCVICLCTNSRNLTRLPCGHRFHKKCIEDYHVHDPNKCPFRCHQSRRLYIHPMRDPHDEVWNQYLEFAERRNRVNRYSRITNRITTNGPFRYERVGNYIVETLGRYVHGVTENGVYNNFMYPTLYSRFMSMEEDYTGVVRLQWDEGRIRDHIIQYETR